MGPQVSKSAEPIPGYTILERIGAGGYGEVWKADAPGGLTKAIKFVYGYFSDERAAGELKALNRIREVRHPFLLSLERIEVIDGQLVIVTELADESLKDRFEATKAGGQIGIERQELLNYLSDAADALDYMRERHSLQHLDVKPENLLLLGERVKVADFGLVKDVYATGASLMGGMTPVYAPPEVFDGRPSRFSDQYSLAIVYQEMLTGVLPFSGKTAAQLAKQHTSSPPRLSPLSPSDQGVIAVALAKDPEKRFPSCRALIERLRSGGEEGERQVVSATAAGAAVDEAAADTKTVAGSETEPAGPAVPQPSTVKTMSIDGSAPRRSTRVRRSGPAAPQPSQRTEAVDLPPLELTDSQVELTPTLYIGIGGTAAKTLKRLRRRLSDRFGGVDAVPVLQMLLIDTDSNDLVLATRGEREERFHDMETVAAPLRRPQEYRRDAPQLLSWLSRRWLYNIPRSLQTHGLRPLGRLALVDHAPKLFDRMRRAIRRAIDEASVTQSSENTGHHVRDSAPRVVIVASISGGTGSGMVLDMAYAARQALREMELGDQVVRGMLVHSTSRKEEGRDLAITNAYACLGELYTYSHPEGFYPGDSACGLQPCETGRSTFDDAYLVHLGDDLSDREYAAGTQRIADYLYVDAVTRGGQFLDTCRRLELEDIEDNKGEARDVSLRTFGMCQVGCSQDDLAGKMGNLLCLSVLHRWRGDVRTDRDADRELTVGVVRYESPPEGSSAEQEIDSLVQQQIELVGLQLNPIAEHFEAVAREQVGGELDSVCRDAITAGWQSWRQSENVPAKSDPVAIALKTIEAVVGYSPVDEQEDDGVETPEVGVPLNDLIGEAAERHASELNRSIAGWIMDLANTGPLRLSGSLRAASAVDGQAKAMEDQARAELARVRDQLRLLARKIVNQQGTDDRICGMGSPFHGDGRPATARVQWLMEYGAVSVRAVNLKNVCRVTQSMQTSLASIQKRLRDVRGELDRLVEAFDILVSQGEPPAKDRPTGDLLEDVARAAAEMIRLRVPELAAQVDQQFRGDFLEAHGGLCGVLTGNVDLRATLPGALRSCARSILRPALRDPQIVDWLLGPSGDGTSEKPGNALEACLEAATPSWTGCGGARRLLLVLPERAEAASLAQQIVADHSAAPSIVHDPDPEVRFCFEVERLPLAALARSLVEHNTSYIDIAARLHTRIDVEWTKLGAGSLPS
ncbi:MAG: tubulin-like doman-containing protein [Pirellulales bacterium]